MDLQGCTMEQPDLVSEGPMMALLGNDGEAGNCSHLALWDGKSSFGSRTKRMQMSHERGKPEGYRGLERYLRLHSWKQLEEAAGARSHSIS